MAPSSLWVLVIPFSTCSSRLRDGRAPHSYRFLVLHHPMMVPKPVHHSITSIFIQWFSTKLFECVIYFQTDTIFKWHRTYPQHESLWVHPVKETIKPNQHKKFVPWLQEKTLSYICCYWSMPMITIVPWFCHFTYPRINDIQELLGAASALAVARCCTLMVKWDPSKPVQA